MELFAPITQMASAFREFVAPRYRPELYYMRGPGPASSAACAGCSHGSRDRRLAET